MHRDLYVNIDLYVNMEIFLFMLWFYTCMIIKL